MPKKLSKEELDELAGTKVGRLTVIEYSHKKENKRHFYNCICECGNIVVVDRSDLITKHTSSCGCILKNKWNDKVKNEGYIIRGSSVEYATWLNIKDRCYNINNIKDYKDYGGRGIIMYEEWLNDFNKFYEYVGKKPSKTHSIDRIDVNGNYEPGNVRWATKEEQSVNKTTTINLTWQGKTQCLTYWARELGVSKERMRRRYILGYTDKDLFKPARQVNNLVEFNGKIDSITNWALFFNWNPKTFYHRIKKGYTIEELSKIPIPKYKTRQKKQ